MEGPLKHPDIEKLRRFSLASGILLITYYAAVVEFSSPTSFTIFGLNVIVLKQKYLSIGLILTSFLSTLRFILYGILIKQSPHAMQNEYRKNIIAPEYKTGEYNKYEYRIYHSTESKFNKSCERLESIFPGIMHIEDGFKAEYSIDSDTNIFRWGEIYSRITRKTNILAWLLNIDYTAPIWLNIIALSISFYKLQ